MDFREWFLLQFSFIEFYIVFVILSLPLVFVHWTICALASAFNKKNVSTKEHSFPTFLLYIHSIKKELSLLKVNLNSKENNLFNTNVSLLSWLCVDGQEMVDPKCRLTETKVS